MKILFIAGHGAGDSGALGNGYREADLTRELVGLIAPKMRKYCTVDVRDTNRNAFYDAQKGTFSAKGYDYVFEIHFNAFNGKAYGSECYVTSSEQGITVEQLVMKGMSKFFTLRDNDSIFDGVKRTNFLVIQTAKNQGVSGTLLEVCFIDNINDIKKYQENKNAIADAIVNGLAEGFGLKETSQPAPTPIQPAEPPKREVDQVLEEMETFEYGNIYRVDDIDIKRNLIYNKVLGGWISGTICTEINGNNDQLLEIGEFFTIKGTFTVGGVDVKRQLIYVKEHEFWVRAESLIEV
ncbi:MULTISPECIES: N-acetylmuramoyl-L-alanine amidase [unclassified Breznakia]|uniref:N-acetylmuramoyl-L-alanine amidase n=1 Tax=unclassified Breznakia TaxID=2623764 RepID=UPI002475F283|nr:MULTISPECIES: N-acetylmuramoyl-L-alanine amidase [unclassified Breznakia]MDH6367123.1 N-acetylmuramoyl-L-alanine amidase [Breznakia sp. PH1-1]MDH6404290.1 N-acetylmuramoyl-L-alanine amidase [Breznakia sp. PF1-11]MDH6412010.1 N-acetylmuramoyl-L-alanine amidase [Breznakia sp. PFB1-11]MDH6414278.1 N-acetylmuramoyl-L-alanine amidase [Breznakia sp. PFB1-14]MDH6416624.1 N-acetylmuramoyl-L-alanine amidase [Breznakia sp. PFB1-4]